MSPSKPQRGQHRSLCKDTNFLSMSGLVLRFQPPSPLHLLCHRLSSVLLHVKTTLTSPSTLRTTGSGVISTALYACSCARLRTLGHLLSLLSVFIQVGEFLSRQVNPNSPLGADKLLLKAFGSHSQRLCYCSSQSHHVLRVAPFPQCQRTLPPWPA